MTTDVSQQRITRAAGRSVLARLMAELLSEPCTESLSLLRSPETRADIRRAAAAVQIDAGAVFAVLDHLPGPEAWRAELAALFGHAVRGACPPYELEYARGMVFQQADTLADVSAFYRAFGLTSNGPLQERPDHVVAEWEFLAVAALREAQAYLHEADPIGHPAPQDHPPEAPAVCRDAQRWFLKDHPARWMPAFFARLRRHAEAAHLCRTATLGDGVLRALCREFEVPYGPEWLELRPVEEEDLHIECSPAQEPGQVVLGPTLAAAMARSENP